MSFLFPLLLACSGDTIKTDSAGNDTDKPSNLKAPPLVINEFLAVNDSVNADPAGEYDDWVELHNTGSSIVQLDGLYLSDDDANPLKFPLPSGRGIDGGGFMIFWADDDDGVGDSGAPSQGADHLSFKLSAEGEMIILTYAEGGDTVQVDAIEFGQQQPNISAQRVPDGSTNWQYGTPTPGASNGG